MRPPLPGVHAGVFAAVGVFGQLIYINPGDRVVAVVQSAWRKPEDIEGRVEMVTLLRAAVQALRGDSSH